MTSKQFHNTLKILKVPRIHKIDPSTFDSYFKDENMKIVLECFCNFTENNLLTDEELKKYNALTPDEIAYLETLPECDDRSEKEARKEERVFLAEQKQILDDHDNLLEDQKLILNEHLSDLHKEREQVQKVLDLAEKEYDNYISKLVPEAETKFVEQVFAKITSVQEFPVERFGIKSSEMDEYFNAERAVTDQTSAFVKEALKLNDFEKGSKLKVPGITRKQLLKELAYLRKIVKLSEMKELSSYGECNVNKMKLKMLEEHHPKIWDISNSQLLRRLHEEEAIGRNLKEKVGSLMERISTVAPKFTLAKSNEVYYERVREINNVYKTYLNILSGPFDALVQQRARLELILCFLDMGEKMAKYDKTEADATLTFLQALDKGLIERKMFYEGDPCVEDIASSNNQFVEQDSLLHRAFKILSDRHPYKLDSISFDDVEKELEKVQCKKELFGQEMEVNLSAVREVEELYIEARRSFSKGRKFDEFCQKDFELNRSINQLSIDIQEVQDDFRKCANSKSDREKLLNREKNLQLARNLFVLALLDEDEFHRVIDSVSKTINTV